jgi:hypothetical protein
MASSSTATAAAGEAALFLRVGEGGSGASLAHRYDSSIIGIS